MLPALAALATIAADRPPPPVLLPLGAWVVEAETDTCLVQRSYGTREARITVGFQPVFGLDSMDLVVLTPLGSGEQQLGKARLRVGDAAAPIEGNYSSVRVNGKPLRYTRISVDRALLDTLGSAETLSIQAKPVNVRVRLASVDRAMAAFRTCQDGLLRSWGVDPATVTPERQPRPRNLLRYFSPESYPAEAARERIVGRVIAVVQVDATGKVTACRITASAGPALNAGTCRQAMKVPFEPATGVDGRPAPSIYVLPVRWLMF
jgi:TonB family protein